MELFKQVDVNLPKYKSKWEYTCPSCSNIFQACYIGMKGKIKRNSLDCRKCANNKLAIYLTHKNLTNNPAKDPLVRQKMRKAKLGLRGEQVNNWRGGTTDERRKAMVRDDYRNLRRAVLIRDNFTCQMCNKRGGQLDLDHIKEWCNYPELRYEVSNCRSLCRPCHVKTDNFGHKAKRNKK